MTKSEIKRVYHQLGLPYLPEDWGERASNGESSGPQTQTVERRDRVKVVASSPDMLWWWEKQTWPWRQRGGNEADWLRFLEEFFTPYIALLPRAKGNLIRQVMGDMRTYADVGEEQKVSRQAAHAATMRAVRDLTRLIANDDPDFVPPADGRRRDLDAERDAAWRVLARHLLALRHED